MDDNIDFSLNDVFRFREGSELALDSIYELDRVVDAEANRVLFEAERIIEHVKGEMNVMEDDRKTAEDVREHNRDVLSRMEQRLSELEREASQLAASYSTACQQQQAAAAAESKLRNTSVPSTGNSEADAKLAAIREKQLAAAGSNVRAANQQVSDIQSAQRSVDADIRALQKAIRQVKRTIEELGRIIKRLEEKLAQASEYLRKLTDAKHQLEWKFRDYSNAYHNSTLSLRSCISCSDQAEEHGRMLLQLLDPDGHAASNDCRICFRDRNALSHFARELDRLLCRYEDTERTFQNRRHGHSATLQDTVPAAANRYANDICGGCNRMSGELKETAQTCRKAERELHAYCALYPSAY